MSHPALVLLLAATLAGLTATPVAAETSGAGSGTHGVICVQLTFPGGTSSPNICVPNPL